MEKPELEKIIKKLESLDIRAWESESILCYYSRSRKIHVRLDGLVFTLEKHENPSIIKRSYSYFLELRHIEDDNSLEQESKYLSDPYAKSTLTRIRTSIAYPDHDKNRKLQQKMIGNLYEKVYEGLKKHREAEIKERLTSFLGFEIDDFYKPETFSLHLINILEDSDKELWKLENDDYNLYFTLETHGLVFQLYKWKPVESPMEYNLTISNTERDIQTRLKLGSNQGDGLYEKICALFKRRGEDNLKEQIRILLSE